MGNCAGGLSPEEAEAQKRSQALDRQMRSDMNKDSEVVKLLLLGAGESGKRSVAIDGSFLCCV